MFPKRAKRVRSAEWSKAPVGHVRLDLACVDGAAWFSAKTFYYRHGATPSHYRATHPDLAAVAVDAWWIDTVPVALLSRLAAQHVQIADRIVVYACAAQVMHERVLPHVAARKVLGTLEALQLPHALLDRYNRFHKLDVALVYAIFQHLQLPFAQGYWQPDYPLPLHRFPALHGGYYVTDTHLTNHMICKATFRETLLADVTVWYNVLKHCTDQSTGRLACASRRMKCIANCFRRDWLPVEPQNISSCVHFVFNIEAADSLFCDE